MSTVQNLNCYLEYDEGVMEIVIIDAVIQMGIHAWGSTLNLSLERDGANLRIKHNAAEQSVQPTIATAALEDSPFETGIRRHAVVLSNRNSG